MRVIKILAGIVIVLIIISVTGFQYFFRSTIPEYEGVESLKGLKETVEVRTDAHGIPHISARNEEDLYFAQGYIIARERLFQMDMTRLAGRGELSTLFGERTIDKDRFLRTVGFYRHAVKSYPELFPETKMALKAFSAGVNEYINTADPLPREYFLLGAEPQPWTPEDSIVVAMLMSYSLTRSKKIDLVMHKIRERAGDLLLEEMIPSYPVFAPTLAVRQSPLNRDAAIGSPVSGIVRSTEGVSPVEDGFPFSLDIAASNWMIFSGQMTETGKAMFAGSPDLAPTLPALFYLMRLKAGDIDAMGGVLPGVPGLGPLGFNGHFAFSAVNGRGDEMDYFMEKLNPDNPDQYLTEEGYRDFEVIEETIRIKSDNGFRTENMKVRISRHGPIISDTLPDAPENCAMQWSALELPSRDIDGLIRLLKARSFDEFREALRYTRTINLNIGYADVDNNIGWQFTAAPPIRKKGYGTVPVPGWTGEYDWQGFIPYENLPFDLNPQRGYVASFNNEPGNVSYHLTNYYLFERAMRFQQIIDDRPGEKVSFSELKDMQLDTVSIVAQRWVLPTREICAGNEKLDPCQELFRNWDFRIDKESAAATLFNYFYYVMMGNTLKDEIGEKIWSEDLGREYLYYVPDLVLTKIVNQPDHPFYDDKNTPEVKEGRDQIIEKSMEEAVQYLKKRFGDDTEEWKWGKVHKMSFDHPLGSKLAFLNLEPIPTHGSHHTINSGFWDSAEPFKMSGGGVIRMMVDFANLENATIISPPGQSGHYMSPFYDNLAETWADGDQVPMHYLSWKNLSMKLELKPTN